MTARFWISAALALVGIVYLVIQYRVLHTAHWGEPGHNVHVSETGSDVDDRHIDGGHS